MIHHTGQEPVSNHQAFALRPSHVNLDQIAFGCQRKVNSTAVCRRPLVGGTGASRFEPAREVFQSMRPAEGRELAALHGGDAGVNLLPNAGELLVREIRSGRSGLAEDAPVIGVDAANHRIKLFIKLI